MTHNLHRALSDIAVLRSQIARSTEFRGYGPATLVGTGILAAAGALAQAQWLPDPGKDIRGYLLLWSAIALLSAVIVGVEVIARSRRVHRGLADEMIRQAVAQFLPAAFAGALLTLVLMQSAESLWLLPGLWQILLSLGVFASCRSLPRPMLAVGLWYLATGLACVAWAKGDAAFSPWAMGLPFGFGQLLAAAVLHFAGRQDDES